jgi:uncharacterized protein (TIGR02599 family)
MLPPVIELTMVALDGPSIDRLAAEEGPGAMDVAGRSGATFTSVTAYDSDMAVLEDYLNGRKVNYRIFRSAVILPAASRGAL